MKKLLIIGFVWPEPKSSAAGTRMIQLIMLYLEMDYEITFVSTAQNISFSANLNIYKIKTVQIVLNDSSFDDFCYELQPDIVLFDRFLTEEQFGWRVASVCANAIRILDTEDLHSLRLARQKAVKENREFTKNDLLISEIAKREIASIYRCDLSLMVSEYEIALLQEIFSVPKFLIYYLPITVQSIIENTIEFNDRENFVFIGNFLHEPNYDAVKFLSDNIWNGIHELLPNAKMNIYGAYPMQKLTELNNPKKHFYIRGRAENASEIIKKSRVILAPIRFGAGIKGKLLEGMECGTPSITSTVGSESMHGSLPWNGFICDDDDDFIKKSALLYQDESTWRFAKKNGYDLIKNRYLKALFETSFKQKIKDLEHNYAQFRLKNFTGILLMHHTANSTKYMSKWIEEKNKKPL